MTVNLESMSRADLMEAVETQMNQIKILQRKINRLQGQVDETEGQYEELAGLLMRVRQLIN